MLLVEIVDSVRASRQEIETTDLAPHERINKLIELGIDTVVCGGIDRWSAESLQSSNVKIYAGNTGEAEDALKKLIEGELLDDKLFNRELNPNRPGCAVGRRGQHANRSPATNGCRRRGRCGPRGRRQDES